MDAKRRRKVAGLVVRLQRVRADLESLRNAERDDMFPPEQLQEEQKKREVVAAILGISSMSNPPDTDELFWLDEALEQVGGAEDSLGCLFDDGSGEEEV